MTMKLDYPEIWLYARQSKSLYDLSGAFMMIHEKAGERFISPQVVPITASGLQG
jgi:hypothetical protein